MFQPLRKIGSCAYQPGDVLVVFGEVFQRGYINGLIDEARRHKMKVIFGTVGRRDEAGQLRPLTNEELSGKDQPVINIPLEAGFDMEVPPGGKSPCQQLEGVKLSEWLNVKLDYDQIEISRKQGEERFKKSTAQFLREIEKLVPQDSNILFAHTMAGGVPRAKIIMPALNRVFKGHGDRYSSSREFWSSPLGRLSDLSFMEVTANTFQHLIDQSEGLRERQKKNGKNVSYVAYGYHGTEILIDGQYRWQSYSPYLQGFAKLELEKIALQSYARGIHACCFNAPEILTNSSSIFLGVEVALYPLLGAFLKEGKGHHVTRKLVEQCEALLKEGQTLDMILERTSQYFSSKTIAQDWSKYPEWPQHNGPEQMALMREVSTDILSRHRDEKHLLTAVLSEIVFRACGTSMLHEGFKPTRGVHWIGHDLVAHLALNPGL